MTIVIAVVLGLDGAIRVRRQLITFENDTRRDHLSMGRATSAAITEAWQSFGAPMAMDLMARIERKTVKVTVRWRDLGWLKSSPETASRMADYREGVSTTHILKHDGEEKRMVSRHPVRPDGRLVGAIELNESLAGQTAHIQTTILRTAATTVLVILICAGATLFLGLYLIGRPVRLLVRQASRIGKGHFDTRLAFRFNDEIAELAAEMNQMADRLAGAAAQIERETQARLETLEQLRHADRLKTVGQLTSGVVHEIGTPLTVIAGRARMIVTGDVEGDESKDCARIVVQQAERVTRTVRQILDFARKTSSAKVTGDLKAVVSQMVSLLQPVAVKTGIYLVFETPLDSAPTYMDAGQVQQVLANLIINAVQASRSGGHVTVRLDGVTACPPDVQDAEASPYWRISVEDEGEGISPEVMSHIFDSFFTTKASGNGTGLGLAISKELVKEHGGWIAVSSEVNRGSVFDVFFPV